tara:strand:- start:2361 stop:2684 length:324 start_codon:yes stop_codon:yes gene_type:complete
MIHITDDHFVWLDVTDKCNAKLNAYNYADELFATHELYEVTEEGRDSLIEEVELIKPAIARGSRICIEVGHLPKQYHPKQTWKDTDKKLIDGYWYVKMADINLHESK